MAVRILKKVKYKQGLAWAKFEPSKNPKMSFSIEFSDAAIGTQSKTLDMSNGSFVRELCDSRTFCRYSEVEDMRSKGFALGGSYENAVVVDGKNVLSPGGLRHSRRSIDSRTPCRGSLTSWQQLRPSPRRCKAPG